MQKLFRSLIAVGGLAGLVACGDDVSITEPNNPLQITGAPVTAVAVGAKVQLSASEAATWASSASNVASVDGTGLVTAVAAGTASITATATADVTKKASVTITVTAPAVRNVTVSPPAVTMNPGGTQGFVANVDADAGVARTVTWTSSNNAVVTITAAGVATAVAPGAATIIAASTAAPTVTGAASVTVRTPTPAVVTIDRVTVGNTLTPVNFLAVVGQIDVSVNVDPGDFILSKVELLIDGVVCPGCTQSFTAAQSQAMSAAAVYGDSIAGAVSSVLFSVQTSQFNVTTGVPNWTNKSHVVSARATLTNAGQTSTASSNRDMTFANQNTWTAAIAYTGTTATATGTSGTSAGLAYKRGGITVTVVPVIYNEGQTVVGAGGQVSFGSFTCDAFSVNGGTFGGTRTVSLSTSAPFTAVFPQARPGNNTNTRPQSVENYEFGSGLCPNIPGETPVLTAVDNNGNNVFAGAGPCIPAGQPGGPFPLGQFCPPGSQAFIRLDNNAPSQVTAIQFNANPNRRLDGWVNANINLNAQSANNNPDGWTINGSADNGVGGGAITSTSYLRFLRVGDGTDGTVNAARAATAVGSYTAPPPTVANNSLCAILTVRDELGNETARPAADAACTPPFLSPGFLSNVASGSTSLRFGVDIAPPVAAYDVSSLPNDGRISGGTMGANFVLTVSDTGTVGNSGMLAGNAIVASVIRREADGTILSTTPGPTDCVVGSLNTAQTTCSQSSTGGAGTTAALPLVWANVAAQTIAGYYTFNGTVSDAAGNTTTAPAPRIVAYDNTPASATAPAVPATITGPFAAASFLNDNLSIRDYFWTSQYGALTFRLGVLPTVVDAFNAATLSNINFGINQVVTTWLGLQDGTTTPPSAYVANAFPLTGLQILVRDQTQAAYSASAVAPVAPTPPATGVVVTNWTGAFGNTNSGTSTLCALAAASGGCVAVATANDSTQTTFRATATGTTAVFNNPFSRVDFYGFNGSQYVVIGTVTSPTLVDNGATRIFTWTLPTVSANTLFTLLGGVAGGAPGAAIVRPILAIGSNATGLVGMLSAAYNLTINP